MAWRPAQLYETFALIKIDSGLGVALRELSRVLRRNIGHRSMGLVPNEREGTQSENS
jgi:hypothetical protein